MQVLSTDDKGVRDRAPGEDARFRIAVLVHNGVLRDARVIKQATSLAKAGFDVEVHGISPENEEKKLSLCDGTVPLLLRNRRQAVTTQSALIYVSLESIYWIEQEVAGSHRELISLYVSVILAAVLLVIARLKQKLFWSEERIISVFKTTVMSFQVSVAKLVLALDSSLKGGQLASRVQLASYRHTSSVLRESVSQRPPPDAVHLHDHIALMAAKSIKSEYNCPVVWDAHEIYEDLANAKPEISATIKLIVRTHVPDVDRFVTINNSIARFYADNYQSLTSATIVKNAAVFSEVPEYDGRLHEASGLPRDQRILLFQGGLAPHRGLTQLVEAAGRFNDNWTLVLMGWGALEQELRDRIELLPKREVPSVVMIPGVPHAELQDWTAGACLGAIPYENISLNHLYCTPNKLWEYPAAGVPILCTDLVEMGQVIREHEIGFLLPRSFSSDDIANAVNALSAEDLARAAQNCRSFIEDDNWEVYGARLVSLYQELAAAKHQKAVG